MFEDRSLRLDVFALGLLALTVFLGVAVWTYDPLDPPSTAVDPPIVQINNACGRSGAYCAYYLFELIGWAVYYLLGSMGVLTVLLLARRDIKQPVLRTTGWCMSLIGLATLLSIAMQGSSPGPIIGAGGYLGALCEGLLEFNFARAGALILTSSVILAGLLLATDYLLLRLVATTTVISAKGLIAVGHLGNAAADRLPVRNLQVAGNDQQQEEEDEEEYEDEDEAEYDDEEYDEAEDEYADEDEDERGV